MASKYYAVRKGRQPGIYATWAECQKQISGFSGAAYKSFTSKAEAEAFVLGGAEQKDLNRQVDLVAYVDGSYDKNTHAFSYGMVIFDQGKELRFGEKYEKHPYADMRNVAGEIIGAQKAMQYCLEQGHKNIDLYYDYEGISKWCTGEWKANKEGTQEYKKFYDAVTKQIDVKFVKVKGHSGDRYNDLADQLAKNALFGSKGSKIEIEIPIEANVVSGDEGIEAEDPMFAGLKGNKASVSFGFLHNGMMFTEKDLLNAAKEQWRSMGRLQKEIQEIKSFFDVEKGEFVFQIKSMEGASKQIKISFEELVHLM